MNEIKVGIDLDGVCCNFTYSLSKLANRFFKSKIIKDNKKEILFWDFNKWYISDDKLNFLWKQIDKSDNFWIKLKLLNKTDWKQLKEFSKDKRFVIYFITFRKNGQNLYNQTLTWLIKKGFKNPQLIFAKKKVEVIKALNIKYFIDDHLETCQEVGNYYDSIRNGLCCLFDYKYNQSKEFDLKNYRTRVDSLGDFLEMIKEIECNTISNTIQTKKIK
jgi:uncharacterized HAD superfamily protein